MSPFGTAREFVDAAGSHWSKWRNWLDWNWVVNLVLDVDRDIWDNWSNWFGWFLDVSRDRRCNWHNWFVCAQCLILNVLWYARHILVGLDWFNHLDWSRHSDWLHRLHRLDWQLDWSRNATGPRSVGVHRCNLNRCDLNLTITQIACFSAEVHDGLVLAFVRPQVASREFVRA
jgi:hypothetical protein